ncbi:MAG: 2,3,4,5-tetrahydropyridine-2,6-dicarboxylate N-succinyltransferase, partial [Mucinivorans sp.]
MKELENVINKIWDDRSLVKSNESAVREVIEQLDKGLLRCAEPTATGQWQVNEWVKKAVILYFPLQEMRTMHAGELEFHDKMDLKHGYRELGIRVVPHAVARYGAYIAPGVVMMPSYV